MAPASAVLWALALSSTSLAASGFGEETVNVNYDGPPAAPPAIGVERERRREGHNSQRRERGRGQRASPAAARGPPRESFRGGAGGDWPLVTTRAGAEDSPGAPRCFVEDGVEYCLPSVMGVCCVSAGCVSRTPYAALPPHRCR